MRRAQSFTQTRRGLRQPYRLPNAVGHIRVGDFNVHKCVVCLTTFDANRDLEAHARDLSHSAFLCSCNRSYSRHCSLKRHISAKNGMRVFECEWCDEKTFLRLDKLRDHWKSFHKVGRRALEKMSTRGCQHYGPLAPPSDHSTSSTVPTSSPHHRNHASFEGSPRPRVPGMQSYMPNPAWTGSEGVAGDNAAFSVSASTLCPHTVPRSLSKLTSDVCCRLSKHRIWTKTFPGTGLTGLVETFRPPRNSEVDTYSSFHFLHLERLFSGVGGYRLSVSTTKYVEVLLSKSASGQQIHVTLGHTRSHKQKYVHSMPSTSEHWALTLTLDRVQSLIRSDNTRCFMAVPS